MSAKRDKFPKGRRGPVKEGQLHRKRKDSKKTAVRVTRKQKDVTESGTKRKVNKSPRKVPAATRAHRKGV